MLSPYSKGKETLLDCFMGVENQLLLKRRDSQRFRASPWCDATTQRGVIINGSGQHIWSGHTNVSIRLCVKSCCHVLLVIGFCVMTYHP